MPRLIFLWISAQLRASLKKDLNKDFSQARLRYWYKDDKRVFILEEIGKELPITFGIVVQGG